MKLIKKTLDFHSNKWASCLVEIKESINTSWTLTQRAQTLN